MKKVLTVALLGFFVAAAGAQTRCVAKEFAQYKEQLTTGKGRYNLPLDYCVADLRQAGWSSSSQPYADCLSEMGKMKDAMLGARQPKLLAYAEAGCNGDHPLDPVKK